MKSSWSTDRAGMTRKIASIGAYIGISLFFLFAMVPLWWVVMTSLKFPQEVLQYPPTLYPHSLTFSNYEVVWNRAPLGRFMLNSLIQTGPTVVTTVFLAAMMGYAFSKHRFFGRDFLFLVVLSSMMLPVIVRIIPMYLMMSDWKWVNTYQALIIPELTTGFQVFMMRQFMQTIPDELIEAARIDGASEPRIFFTLMLPLVTPAIAAMVIFRFMYMWNYFLWPLIVIQNMDMRTLPLGVALFQARYTVSYQLLMACSVISILPILVVFMFLQRHFIRGVTLTGIKV